MRKRPTDIAYPLAHRSQGERRFHGHAVADPYDWLGGELSAETLAWEAAQDALTDHVVGGPAREYCEAWLEKLLTRPHSFRVIERGTRLFFLRDEPGRDQPALYVREGQGAPRLMFDPASLNGNAIHGIVQQSIAPSPDGRHVAMAVTPAGGDAQTIIVVEIATGRTIDGSPPKTIVPTIDWRGNDGFFYNRNQGPFVGPADRMTTAEGVYWHRVGTSFNDDVLVHEKAWDPAHVSLPAVSADGATLFVADIHLTARRLGLSLYDLEAGPSTRSKHQLIAPGDAFALYLGDAGDESFFETDLGGVERGRVVAVNRKRPGTWRDVIGEGKDAIAFTSHALRSANAIVSGGKIYLTHVRDARHRLAAYALTGEHLHDVPLPAVSSLAGPGGERFGELSVGGDGTSLLFELWTHTHRQLPVRYRPDTKQTAWLFPDEVDAKALSVRVEQIFCEMDDGVRVPVFILDAGEKGPRPTLLYGYGGFGASITPEFSPDIPLWLKLGGRYVIANIRGGGEYGKAWYEAGRGRNRQRVFDDFCAVAKALVDRDYATRDTLAIRGISNGGLLTAACAVQRPELFAAAVSELPLVDGLALGSDPWSQALQPEYGNPVVDEGDFEVIHKWSPLHAVKRGWDYPPILVVVADQDSQMLRDGAHRFVATLQHENPQALALFRLVRGCGHTGWPRSATVRTIAEEIVFLAKSLDLALDWTKELSS